MTKSTITKWTPKLAYAIGLFVADGHLSKDGRHLEFTSKDLEQVQNFAECLGLKHPITRKSRSAGAEKKYFHIQFGDIGLYRFFNSIGIFNRKSLTIKKVEIPEYLMADFVRGYLDGDGSIGYNYHPESKHIQVKIRFSSGSYDFLNWLKTEVSRILLAELGHIARASRCWQLVYCKKDSLILIDKMYYDSAICLKRKFDVSVVIKGLL